MDTSLAFALERDMPPLPDLDDVWELMRQWRIRLVPMPDHVFGDIHKTAMNLLIGRFKNEMDRRVKEKPVLGILFINQMPRIFQDGEWGLSGATIKYATSLGMEFDLVVEQFFRGLPGFVGDV
jgi:hypothetical protein